jgi:hypothetical protein
LDRSRIEGLRWRLGLTNLVVKDCKGRSGGLALFWRNGVDFQLRTVSRLYIDGDVKEKGFIWHFTGFYGEPSSDKKEVSWRALRTLNVGMRRPWLCMGDFNEVFMSYEKEGGQPKSQASMDKFREALEDCQLDDLGFSGDMFTWRNNNHTSEHYIRERLDRAVADVEWCTGFPTFKVRNGDPRHSDHRPVIVSMEEEVMDRENRGHSCFRFEAGLLQEKN